MNKTIDPSGFEAFVQKSLKMSAEEVASLYNEAGELTDFSVLEKKDSERISKLAGDKTNQYNRGLKEGAVKLETALREKYEVDSELIGVELFDHIISTKLEEVKKAPAEEVLKHPEVIKALNEKDRLLRAKDKEVIDKLKAKEDEINAANMFKEFEAIALAKLDNLKPILPSDARKAQAQKSWFTQDLKKNKIQKNDKGEYIILKEDGTTLKDDHGYDVSVDDYVKGISERYFDFKAADDRSSSGNRNEGQKPNIRAPKSKEEYIEMMRDNNLTPQQRVEITDLYKQTKNN